MESEDRSVHARILEGPGDEFAGAMKLGLKLRSLPPSPLELELDPRHPRPIMPLYVDNVPLMAEALWGCFVSAGTDNIDRYDVVLHDPYDGQALTSYAAFNIVGLVDATDVHASTLMMEPPGDAAMEMDFESLVLDHARIPSDLRVFRLAVAGRPIIVHESVRQAIEDAGIAGLRFCGDGEWHG